MKDIQRTMVEEELETSSSGGSGVATWLSTGLKLEEKKSVQ